MMLYQSFGTLYYHLRYSLMMLRKLIKGRVDNFHIFTLNCLLDIGNLFRTFIDQQDDHMHIRIAVDNGF